MTRYILNRLLYMIPIILGVAIFIFTILYFVPGDPAQIILGSEASQADIELLRESLGLGDPYVVQLGRYMRRVFLEFDFGTSYITGMSVAEQIVERLPRTVALGLIGMIMSMAAGIPLGIIAAVRQNGLGDRISMIVALLGVSIPSFWLALLLVILFSVKLKWLPAMGIGGAEYFIMPCIAQAVGGIGAMARQSRSSMLEVIRSDYIVTAHSKGLTEWEVITKHALPNALIPIITIAGSHLAVIFGGSVIIENVFSIPGVGSYMIDAVNNRDYTVIQGCVILLAIIFAVCMLLVDLTYAAVDPRIKAQYMKKKKRVVVTNG